MKPYVRVRLRSGGASLVTAIFLLVVLAGLGVAMVTLSTAQQASVALDGLGVRAYQAARAGLEYGLYERRRLGACPVAVNVNPPAGTSLSLFTVTVECLPTAGPVTTYRIKATACNQPTGGGVCPNQNASPDYVQRVLEARD
ncbi:MSHA biogenesis protein MshP [Oxalobacteraceae bacterium GrIS 1.11]